MYQRPNKHIIRLLRRFRRPIALFIGLQVVWFALLALWVTWFIHQQESIGKLSQALNETPIDGTTGIVALVIGCILLGVILVGTAVLFTMNQIQSGLIKQQKSFVSSVTHELRSPLSSIQLSFETLQRPNLPDDIKCKLMEMVDRDIVRLSQLIDRILLSSRLDRGILDYASQLETFALRDAIYNCVERSMHMDRTLKDRLEITCPESLEVRGIKMAFNMIVGNLLENAIKYSPKGTLIKIEAGRREHEFFLHVKDQGFGLNKRDHRKIFDMFHRTQRAAQKAVSGTGLGLFIVKSMVDSLGGRVWVESEGMGKGSSFFVAFPAHIVLPRTSITTGP